MWSPSVYIQAAPGLSVSFLKDTLKTVNCHINYWFAFSLQLLCKHVWWKYEQDLCGLKWDSCCEMFTKCSIGCECFHILLVMMTSAEYLSTSWVQSFQPFPSEESSAHIGSSLLVSNICRGLTVHWMSCILTGHRLRTQSIANFLYPRE